MATGTNNDGSEAASRPGGARTEGWDRVLKRGLAPLRRTRGWTQHDLAQRSGLHRRTISRLEQPDGSTTHPNRQTITALARAFGYVRVSDLWIELQDRRIRHLRHHLDVMTMMLQIGA